MGCQHGKGAAKKKKGRYLCKKCGAIGKKKDDLCKGKKIKK